MASSQTIWRSRVDPVSLDLNILDDLPQPHNVARCAPSTGRPASGHHREEEVRMQHKRPAIIFSFGVAMLAGVLMAASNDSDRSTFYSGQQFTMNVKPLDAASASAIIARSSQLHSLYLSD